jgi:hypothetical protein
MCSVRNCSLGGGRDSRGYGHWPCVSPISLCSSFIVFCIITKYYTKFSRIFCSPAGQHWRAGRGRARGLSRGPRVHRLAGGARPQGRPREARAARLSGPGGHSGPTRPRGPAGYVCATGCKLYSFKKIVAFKPLKVHALFDVVLLGSYLPLPSASIRKYTIAEGRTGGLEPNKTTTKK